MDSVNNAVYSPALPSTFVRNKNKFLRKLVPNIKIIDGAQQLSDDNKIQSTQDIVVTVIEAKPWNFNDMVHHDQSQKAQSRNRKKVLSSNKAKVDPDDFSLIRKAAGRYVISCNEGKLDTYDKKADIKLQKNSHSLLPQNCYNIMEKKSINIVKPIGISPTPSNEPSVKEKHDAENSLPKIRNSVKWKGYKIDVPVTSIQMKEDFWKDGNSWICCACETTFRLEIAFRNHLRRQEACNQKYVCLTCNDLVYLLDLKSHMSNKPKCVGGKAILESHYNEVLTKK